MDQYIAKGDDPTVVCGACRRVGIVLFQPADGFTDDLKVALHGLAQQPVLPELFQPYTLSSDLTKSAALRMSSSSLGARGSIDRLTRLDDLEAALEQFRLIAGDLGADVAEPA